MGQSNGAHRRAPEWLLSRWQRALDVFPGDGTDRRLLLALSTFANPGGEAHPGVDAWALRAGCHRATVFRRAPTLERAGWISRSVPGGGRSRTTTYQLTIPETVASMGATVSREKPSHHRQKTVAPRSEKPSHGHAQREARTDLNRENSVGASAELAPEGGSASGAEPTPWGLLGLTLAEYRRLPREERDGRLAAKAGAAMCATEDPDPFAVLDAAFEEEVVR